MSELSTPPTYDVTIPARELTKGQSEYHAFLRLLPELLSTHRGLHVAVHEGRVIDSDKDDIALVRRVHARIGYVPIHVGLVSDKVPVARVPHYREYRPGQGG